MSGMGSGSFGDLVRAGVPVDRIRELTDGTYAYAAPCPAERMSGVDELVTWLRAQLDEDERVARATVPGPWHIGSTGLHVHSRNADLTVMENVDSPGPWHRALPEHVTRWDPARVLAEVDAKRRLLRQFELRAAAVRGIDGVQTGGVWDDMLRLLALPYADRPGYREVWRPV